MSQRACTKPGLCQLLIVNGDYSAIVSGLEGTTSGSFSANIIGGRLNHAIKDRTVNVGGRSNDNGGSVDSVLVSGESNSELTKNFTIINCRIGVFIIYI